LALHHDLLAQARHLASQEPKKPRQASLRRAVSTAYYALFHFLVCEGTSKLISNKPANLRPQVRRAFAHGDMRAACEFFTGKGLTDPNNSNNLLHLLATPIEAQIRNVAATFIDLQQARHSADYDHIAQLTRVDALLKVRQAEQAFLDWKAVRDAPNANVFLATLLFHNRWRR
jgi:hypothetical protein